MYNRQRPRLMLVSTHGYVTARPRPSFDGADRQVTYILDLARQLGAMGYVVDVLTRQFDGQPTLEPLALNVTIVRFPCGGPRLIGKDVLWRHLGAWSDQVVKYANRRQLRYLLVSSHYWDAGYACSLLAARLKLPHVFTPHALGAARQNPFFAGSISGRLTDGSVDVQVDHEQEVCAQAQMVVATSDDQAQDLIGPNYRVPPAKIRTVGPGYDDPRFYETDYAQRYQACLVQAIMAFRALRAVLRTPQDHHQNCEMLPWTNFC